MKKVEFYQQHLNRVSRSFAFSISVLDEPLREYVGLSYLLCRIADTYEDSPWESKEQQLQQLQEFKKVLSGLMPIEAFEVQPQGLSVTKPHEVLLLTDSVSLIKDYFQLPTSIQKHLRKLLLTMIDGMCHFIIKNPKSKIRIKTLGQLNQYCLFVAGIVGECLTVLSTELAERKPVTKKEKMNAFLFGLFLQKINILKDQAEDEKEGRFFLPSRQLVYKSVVKHVEHVKNYIHSIPESQNSYKIFCLSAFLLGLKTLEVMNPNQAEIVKVSREEAEKLFHNLVAFVENHTLLNEFVLEFHQNLPKEILLHLPVFKEELSLRLYDHFQRNNAQLLLV